VKYHTGETFTRADYRNADKIAKTDPRFGGPGSIVHDYPGALREAKKQRERTYPINRKVK